jgi:DNA primase large subunit
VYDLLAKMSVFENDIPPCIKTLLKNKEMHYPERYAFTIYLANLDFSPDEITAVWRKVMSPAKFKHAISTDSALSMTARSNHGVYNIGCKTFKRIGYCDRTCTVKTLYPFLGKN